MGLLKLKTRFYFPIILFVGIILIGSIVYLVANSGDNQNIINSSEQTQPISTEITKNNESDPLMVALFVVILILLSLSISTNILLFKWRKTAGDGQLSIVPVELMEVIKSLVDSFVGLRDQLSLNVNHSKKESKDTKKLFEDLMEAFTVLQSALNERDKEIKRLKQGYDSEIYRKFLARFIRTDDALSYEMHAAKSGNGNSNYQTLEDIQELLRDAFDECGVSDFSPNIGGDIRNEFGVADGYKTIPARNSEEEFTIAEVVEPGFKIQTPTGPDCIKPAKVVVYIPRKGD